jgi:integrase
LRTGEAAGLRTTDVDLAGGFARPVVQHPAEPLKTEMSRTPIPIPAVLTQELASARRRVDGLPPEFRFHDLRHYFASLLIAAGCDIKTVQARVRHGSTKTTLDTYGHRRRGRVHPRRRECCAGGADGLVEWSS